ncbi:universal stress protein [Arthrobacter sp. TMN-49]
MIQSVQCVLAGVYPGQSPAVVAEAAQLAAALGYQLVCAYSNPARYTASEAADGSVVSVPVDPDFADDADELFPAQLAAALAAQLSGMQLSWRTLLLAGDPAQSLARCASTLAASLIVVGTHGDTHTPLRHVFSHSVAAKLARQQHRPVLVIPTHHGSPEHT